MRAKQRNLTLSPVLFLALFIVLGPGCFCGIAQIIQLADAVRQQMVTLEWREPQSVSDISAKVRRAPGTKPIMLQVPAGTVFRAESKTNSKISMETKQVDLTRDATADLDLQCLFVEMEHLTGKGERYVIEGVHPNKDLQRIFPTLPRDTDWYSCQVAAWVILHDPPLGGLPGWAIGYGGLPATSRVFTEDVVSRGLAFLKQAGLDLKIRKIWRDVGILCKEVPEIVGSGNKPSERELFCGAALDQSLAEAVQQKDTVRSAALLGDYLVFAARTGNAALVQTLLARGAPPNSADQHGGTALIWASMLGMADTAKLLLDKGARTDAEYARSGRPGYTPLIASASHGHSETVHLLLDRGASINALAGNWSAIGWAATNCHVEIVKLLLDKGAEANPPKWITAPLTDAASCRELPKAASIATMLLAHGSDVKRMDSGGNALMRFAQSGAPEIVALLLKNGADINAKTWDDQTALSKAASASNRDVIRLLLARGAEVTPKALDACRDPEIRKLLQRKTPN